MTAGVGATEAEGIAAVTGLASAAGFLVLQEITVIMERVVKENTIM